MGNTEVNDKEQIVAYIYNRIIITGNKKRVEVEINQLRLFFYVNFKRQFFQFTSVFIRATTLRTKQAKNSERNI